MTFDFNEFKRRSNAWRLSPTPKLLAVRDRYLSDNLASLGHGSKRWVWDLGNGTVLKVNRLTDTRQNKKEISASKNKNLAPFLARIIDYDPKYAWLIMEKVEPLAESTLDGITNPFEEWIGLGEEDFVHLLALMRDTHGDIDKLKSILLNQKKNSRTGRPRRLLAVLKKPKTVAVLKKIIYVSQIGNLVFDDLYQWGYRPSTGDIVLYDYGY